jgi:hypothetical protein
MGEILVFALIAILASVTTWMVGMHMRRRIRRATGRRAASEADLTSLTLWMEVDKIEEQRKLSDPIEPK